MDMTWTIGYRLNARSATGLGKGRRGAHARTLYERGDDVGGSWWLHQSILFER